MKVLTTSSPALLATLAVAFTFAPQANAATIGSKYKINAAGNCQGALPAGPGAVLRARPLAVQNEGTITAAATCSFPYNDTAGEEPNMVGVRLINNATGSNTISCTLVSGTATSSAVYLTKSATLTGGTQSSIIWNASELPGAPTLIDAPNFSCSLPPSTGINYIYYYYDRQVGN